MRFILPARPPPRVGMSCQVGLLALEALLFVCDSLQGAEEGDSHPTSREVAIAETVRVGDGEGHVGWIGWEGVAKDLENDGEQRRSESRVR